MNKLEILKNNYEELKAQIEKNDFKINELLKDVSVKKYIKLMEVNEISKIALEQLSMDLEIEKMYDCSHVFVRFIDRIYDWHRCDSTINYYCVKCGLNTEYGNLENQSFLNSVQKKMFSIFHQTEKNGIILDGYLCRPEVSQIIYDEIITSYPDITDEMLIGKFKEVLCDSGKMKENNQKVKRFIKGNN